MSPSQASRATPRLRWRFPLVLTLALWLCLVPLAGIAVVLGLPWQTAWPVLGVTLAASLLACFILCNTGLKDWRRGSDVRAALQVCARHASER